jgi:cellulose synthase/poly-beta-1,6-N-acetylglucosamine synthase-like glycosyltransferase
VTLLLSSAALLTSAILFCFTARRAIFLAAALPRPRRHDGTVTPLVGLLVPASNEAANVTAALEAIAALDYPAERLFVTLVDDGSDDATGDIFRRWAAERPRTITVDLPQPLSKFDALNRALDATPAADVVAVCDADLRPRPDWLRRLVAPFADERVGAVAGYVAPANAERGPVARYAAVESWVHQLITSAAKDYLRLDPPTLGACALRRAALEEIGGFEGGPGGDVRTSAKLTRAGWRTRFVREAVVDNSVAEGWSEYWHQHLRWARNLFATARPRGSRRTRIGAARRIEGWAAAAGYADRVAFSVGVVLVVLGVMPIWPVAVYLGAASAEVAVALVKAGVGRRAPAFFLSTVALFALDVAASLAAAVNHVAGRPREWRRPQRDLSRSAPTA